MYKDIQTYSKKNKFTKFMHGLVFEPIRAKQRKTKAKVVRKRFRTFEGKIIRNINIVTLDPFGFSETDTTAHPKKFMSKAGNHLHAKSKKLTIRNLLLFKKNKPLDSLLVKETERLIRSQKYIRAIAITPKLISKNSDSVDVYIRVLDSWSLIPEISGSNTKIALDLNERNFLGTGHQFENNYKKRYEDGQTAYSTKYVIPNILNSYIKTTLSYQIDLDDNYGKSINIDRPFFSPFAKWGAGIYFDQQFRTEMLPDSSNVYAKQNFKYNTQDFWAGDAIRLFKGNSVDIRTTNLITAGRLLKINYLESPTIAYDSLNVFSSENFYLFGIGISSRQYVEDKFLFNYRIIEDVPVGRVFGITGGYQKKNNIGRLYLGARVSLGKYYRWGYLSSNFEYGTFFNHSKLEQNAFSAQANYFTNLFELGDWKFRQFVKSQLIIGNKRLASNADRLTINEGNGIPGFNTNTLYGTKKFLFTFQTQSYSPYNIWGFRFNPYANYTIGMLGNAESGFKKSKAYSQFGVGVIIRNDYLVFSSFQLSLAFYPVIPGSGDNIFKTNSINSEDFGFQDFEISKPQTVIYR
ncbi:hypothetical protein [Flavobacterium sp.]|uniref:hypothetical protein n=1 Tax=Flavobacterium sp. TaxID=239 RepID=UPI002B4B9256|nr:hypothetical protein [Flavobacterium sp.]HLF51835.1 hypothetical protein [Flavobacterium sp.]